MLYSPRFFLPFALLSGILDARHQKLRASVLLFAKIGFIVGNWFQ